MPTFETMGDQAVLARFSNEGEAFQFSVALKLAQPPWLLDLVQAYQTIAVYFSLHSLSGREVICHLREVTVDATTTPAATALHRIPCCYELGLDLERVAALLSISEEEVIRLHSSSEYTVHAIGFCPGFPYLGDLPPEISNIPRLDRPRAKVPAGSVGLTGRQTGIYSEARPGGWNILGITPLEIVNVRDDFFPMRTGDRVRFERIDEADFRSMQGERLSERPT